MASWESVADIDFVEVRRGAEVTFKDGGSAPITTYDMTGNIVTGATLTVPDSYIAKHGSAVDQYAYQTYLHEIGHLFGLGHPGRYDGSAGFGQAAFANDSWLMSVMSYFAQDENPNVDASRAVVMTPMAADIAALQRLYGAPGSDPTAGDTVWGVGSDLDGPLGDYFRDMTTYRLTPGGGGAYSNAAFSFLLRDVGGIDIVDFSNDARPQSVMLEGGQSASTHGLTNNIPIDKGTVIEGWISGNGIDRIIGNAAANRLVLNGNSDLARGKGGNDVIDGGLGSDTLYGNAGRDRLIGDVGSDLLVGGGGADRLEGGDGLDRLSGGGGKDRLYGDAHADRLVGGGGNDLLSGGDGTDMLEGGAGRDRLDGGTGADRLVGGAHADRFVFERGTGTDTIADFQIGTDKLLLDADLLAGSDLSTLLSIPRFLDGELMLRFDSGDRLVLEGVAAAELPGLAGDILLV